MGKIVSESINLHTSRDRIPEPYLITSLLNEASYFLGVSPAGAVVGAGVAFSPVFFFPPQAARPNMRAPRLRNVPTCCT
jgi:hypothetical protein